MKYNDQKGGEQAENARPISVCGCLILMFKML